MFQHRHDRIIPNEDLMLDEWGNPVPGLSDYYGPRTAGRLAGFHRTGSGKVGVVETSGGMLSYVTFCFFLCVPFLFLVSMWGCVFVCVFMCFFECLEWKN